MSLRINCSNIAAIIGKHAYATQSDALLLAWKSSDRESYIAAHERCGVETPEQRKQRIRDYYPDLDTFARSTKPSLLSTNSLLSRDDLWGAPRFLDDGDPKRPLVTRRDAIEVAVETANTSHGIEKETGILQHVNEILGRSFRPVDDLWTKRIDTTPSGRDILIQGRVDAIETPESDSHGPPTVLEIKTRARGLKMTVPEYERIQVESYMDLTSASHAFLVEAYYPSKHPDTVPDINISILERDQDRIDDMIKIVSRVGRVLDHLVSDREFQNTLLKSPSRDRLVAGWMNSQT